MKSMKPQFRGYIPQIAFFIAVCCCFLLMVQTKEMKALIPNAVYSLTLIGMYGISTLYHRVLWNRRQYLIMKSIDHSAIFALIAGTATPICLLGLKNESGFLLLSLLWGIAAFGMLVTFFWAQSPKWVRAFLYVILGWLVIPYYSEIKSHLGITEVHFLLAGGIFYTLGALAYAFKWPNPFPEVFGYHEIFHVLIVIASIFHFIVIYHLTT